MILMNIINVNAKAKISGFDTDAIIDGITNAEYRPNGFPAICIGSDSGITISLFDSGKINSKRAKSTDSAILAINNFVKTLKKLGMKISILSKPSIYLIVTNVFYEKRINIKSLKSLPEFKKEIKRFSSIQLVFPNNVNVLAYENSLRVSGNDISHMMQVVNSLKKHTIPAVK